MPVIKINGQQFALQPGQNRLGGGTTADIVVGDGTVIQAIVDLGSDGRVTIRKSGNDSIRVNGTDLAQPSPLMHGDKVEIGGQDLFFSDDAKGGSTQFVSAADVAAIAAKRSGPSRGTLATGGRLVSLVDGKEYAVPEGGVTIGRDASADIVVAQTAVSRRHAQVIASATGYVVNDLSTNGIFVNGEKVASGHALSRADVIRVGTEDFRFYADLAPMAKSGAPITSPPSAPAAMPVPPKAAVPAPPPVATPAPRPATPPPVASVAPVAKPAAPPAAAAAVKASKSPTPPARPATPPPPPAPPTAEPVTTRKGVPAWAGLVVVIAIGAVAAYFIYAAAK